jgi:hypothetical protein
MTMPNKGDIFEYWKDWLNENGFDWGEPSCWACHRWWDTKYNNINCCKRSICGRKSFPRSL